MAFQVFIRFESLVAVVAFNWILFRIWVLSLFVLFQLIFGGQSFSTMALKFLFLVLIRNMGFESLWSYTSFIAALLWALVGTYFRMHMVEMLPYLRL